MVPLTARRSSAARASARSRRDGVLPRHPPRRQRSWNPGPAMPPSSTCTMRALTPRRTQWRTGSRIPRGRVRVDQDAKRRRRHVAGVGRRRRYSVQWLGPQQLQVESLVGSRSPRDRRVQAAIGDVPDLDMAGQHPFVAAGASATCRRSRSNTSAPTMRSRALICCDSDGAAMCRRSAARPKWSSSATATK